MAKLLKLRRGTTSQHSSFTGAEGEVTVDTDKETVVVHDGSTAGGHPVAAEDMANVSSASIVGRLGTGSIVKAKLEADIIDGTKLADDAVNSEHYVDGSIDTAHIADAQVTHVKLANDCVDGDNIQDDVINSEHIAAGAVDLEHMSSESVDEDNLKISNSGSNGQFLQKQSGNAGGLTWAAPDLSAYAPLSAPALTGTATGVNLTLSGNLTVNGTTTTVATTNTTITDNLLELNSGAGSNANDAGILIERGSTGDNAIIAWDESADKFTVGTTTGTASSTGNISITTGTLVANVEGNVTGNAATATTSTNVVGVANAGNTDYRVPFLSANTGTAAVYTDTDSGITYNPSSGTLTSVNFNGALTGNCSGSSGSCTGNAATATAATNVTVADESSDTDCAVLFTTSYSGDLPVKSGSNLAFNSSSGLLTASGFSGDGSSISDINGGNITSGTVAAARVATLNQNTTGTAGGLSGSPNITVGTIGCGAITGTSTISDSKGNLRSIPSAAKSSAHTLVAADAGKVIYTSSGGVTVPNSVLSAGDAITIINNSGSDQTITQGSGVTLYNTADAATGNRTLAGRGMATIWFASASVAYISGAGLS